MHQITAIQLRILIYPGWWRVLEESSRQRWSPTVHFYSSAFLDTPPQRLLGQEPCTMNIIMNASRHDDKGDILDEDEIVSVDLPEILEGAGPSSKLIVWIVLCHHYCSIAISGTRKLIQTHSQFNN